ncbi:hypothetical protein Ciccas_014034, partial [Cichlidogyrus casuarinus]
SQRENTTPSPSTDSPAGMMVLPAGSRLHSQILTPVLPEKVAIYVLKAARRNCVHSLDVNSLIVTRVISAVYHTKDTEMTNSWRITDSSSEGRVIMSVLCQFLKRFAQSMKRKATKEESSSSRSPTPPKKHFRL